MHNNDISGFTNNFSVNVNVLECVMGSLLLSSSTRGVLGVYEYSLVVHGVRVLSDSSQLDVVFLSHHVRVQHAVQLVVRQPVVAAVRRLIQELFPICRTVLGSVDDVVFDLGPPW